MTKTPTPLIDRQPGSERTQPFVLIGSTQNGLESLFVRELISDKAILRVDAGGYRVLVKTSDKGFYPYEDRSVSTIGLYNVDQVREAVKAFFSMAKKPLNGKELEQLLENLEGLPSISSGARNALRLANGQDASRLSWVDPRWTETVRRQVRGR